MRRVSPWRRLLNRMNAGAQTAVFMPFLGEYGMMLMFWIRIVHFFRARRKVVCCRRGDELYFPSASEFIYDWPDTLPDADRCGMAWARGRNKGLSQFRDQLRAVHSPCEVVDPPPRPPFAPFASMVFALAPRQRRGLLCDVVLGARRRGWQPDRNWPHWDTLAGRLVAAGYSVGLIGKRDTSFDVPAARLRAWEEGDDADANVELLQSCRLYVGTDTGTSHLAAFVSVPSLIFRYDDGFPCWQHMQATTRAGFTFVPDGWNDPSLVVETALATLALRKDAPVRASM
jgi:hypothetical protein